MLVPHLLRCGINKKVIPFNRFCSICFSCYSVHTLLSFPVFLIFYSLLSEGGGGGGGGGVSFIRTLCVLLRHLSDLSFSSFFFLSSLPPSAAKSPTPSRMGVLGFFSLEHLHQLPLYVSKDAYQTVCDDKSGYDHILLAPSSRTYFGFEWNGWYFTSNTIPSGWKLSAS